MPGESEIEIRQVFELEDFAPVMTEDHLERRKALEDRSWRQQ
jgi:hypothetical protein